MDGSIRTVCVSEPEAHEAVQLPSRLPHQPAPPAPSAGHRVPCALLPESKSYSLWLRGRELIKRPRLTQPVHHHGQRLDPSPVRGRRLGHPWCSRHRAPPVAQTPPSPASQAEEGWTGSLGGVILMGSPPQKFQEQGWGFLCGRPVGALASQWGLAPEAGRGLAQGRSDFRGKGGQHDQHNLPSC